MELAGGKDDAERLVKGGTRVLLLHDDIFVIYQSFKDRLDKLKEGVSESRIQ
jgi:hypothetical protein